MKNMAIKLTRPKPIPPKIKKFTDSWPEFEQGKFGVYDIKV